MNMLLEFARYYPQLVYEGATYKDRAVLFLYPFHSAPLYILSMMKGRKYDHKLLLPVAIRNKQGTFKCGSNLFSSWIAGSFHEKEVKDIFDAFHEGVIIDVGAHIGTHTIRASKNLGKNGRVICFEPNKNNFKLLKENLSLNKVTNVSAYNAACSDKSELLFMHGAHGGSYATHLQGKDGQEIRAFALDTLISKEKLSRVDLLKVDVEGFEQEVFKGGYKLISKFKPAIIFEAWDKERLNKISQLLFPLGYIIKPLDHITYFAIQK